MLKLNDYLQSSYYFYNKTFATILQTMEVLEGQNNEITPFILKSDFENTTKELLESMHTMSSIILKYKSRLLEPHVTETEKKSLVSDITQATNYIAKTPELLNHLNEIYEKYKA